MANYRNQIAEIRKPIRQDASAIAEMEGEYFWRPYTEIEIRKIIYRDTSECMAVIDGPTNRGYVLGGYIIYEAVNGVIAIHRIAVAQEMRRRGYGTALIESLVASCTGKLHLRRLQAVCYEQDRLAIAFLRSCGFLAKRLAKGAYGPNDDGYVFERSLGASGGSSDDGDCSKTVSAF